MQRQRIQERLLAKSDLPFRREYRDMLTGTSPNRADHQQMLADAQAGLFSHLGLYRADRLGRNTLEGLQAATRLIGCGVLQSRPTSCLRSEKSTSHRWNR
jgi:DNA invertase Pin-like site-specific DNA recombinase